MTPLEMIVGILSLTLSTIFFLLRFVKPKTNMSLDTLQNRFLVQHNPSNNNLYVIPKPKTITNQSSSSSSSSSPSPSPSKMTSFSPLMSQKAASQLTQNQIFFTKQKYNNLDLTNATFFDYYQKKYGQCIRFPNETLINVHSLEKHALHDLLLSNEHEKDDDNHNNDDDDEEKEEEKEKDTIYIIPELTYALPMPRDVLYMCQHAGRFMMSLERSIELSALATEFVKMGERVDLRMPPTPASTGTNTNTAQQQRRSYSQDSSNRNNASQQTRPPSQSTHEQHAHSSLPSPPPPPPSSLHLLQNSVSTSLPSLLNEATTCTPITYERLEFLGDKVLGYFLSINLTARNANLQWDCDDLGEALQVAVKNTTLTKAALRVGLNRIIYAGHHKWQSAYARKNNLQSMSSLSPSSSFIVSLCNDSSSSEREAYEKEISSVLLQYEHFHHTADISDSTLSNVSESVLACLFLKSINEKTKRVSSGMTIALLEEMELPLPEDRDRSTKAGYPWFTALGPCLDEGYPFELDRKWKKSFIEVGTLLYCNHEVVDTLDRGWKGLVELLEQTTSSAGLRNVLGEAEQKTKVLLFCALFDDSLSEDTEEEGTDLEGVSRGDVTDDSSMASEAGLVRAALLRDTLFFVGNYALTLAISCECYHRYPNATSGDMHLLLACAFSDDVLSYIAIKNGIHEFMYDKESDTTSKILAEMMISDGCGSKLWNRRGGWILSGGVKEFQNRRRLIPCSKNQDDLYPRYEGLAAGRFHGHKDKLPNDMSEDLAFSMKAIAGSLVLSLGLENMWQLLGPLFEELLILSPEDLRREYSNISDLPRNYQRGSR